MLPPGLVHYLLHSPSVAVDVPGLRMIHDGLIDNAYCLVERVWNVVDNE